MRFTYFFLPLCALRGTDETIREDNEIKVTIMAATDKRQDNRRKW